MHRVAASLLLVRVRRGERVRPVQESHERVRASEAVVAAGVEPHDDLVPSRPGREAHVRPGLLDAPLVSVEGAKRAQDEIADHVLGHVAAPVRDAEVCPRAVVAAGGVVEVAVGGLEVGVERASQPRPPVSLDVGGESVDSEWVASCVLLDHHRGSVAQEHLVKGLPVEGRLDRRVLRHSGGGPAEHVVSLRQEFLTQAPLPGPPVEGGAGVRERAPCAEEGPCVPKPFRRVEGDLLSVREFVLAEGGRRGRQAQAELPLALLQVRVDDLLQSLEPGIACLLVPPHAGRPREVEAPHVAQPEQLRLARRIVVNRERLRVRGVPELDVGHDLPAVPEDQLDSAQPARVPLQCRRSKVERVLYGRLVAGSMENREVREGAARLHWREKGILSSLPHRDPLPVQRDLLFDLLRPVWVEAGGEAGRLPLRPFAVPEELSPVLGRRAGYELRDDLAVVRVAPVRSLVPPEAVRHPLDVKPFAGGGDVGGRGRGAPVRHRVVVDKGEVVAGEGQVVLHLVSVEVVVDWQDAHTSLRVEGSLGR